MAEAPLEMLGMSFTVGNFEPSLLVGRRFRTACVLINPFLRLGESTLHMKGGILHLAEEGGNNFLPRGPEAWLWLGHIGLHRFVKPWQGMIGHEREHVVLHMVVHVPVEKAVHGVHMNRAAV